MSIGLAMHFYFQETDVCNSRSFSMRLTGSPSLKLRLNEIENAKCCAQKPERGIRDVSCYRQFQGSNKSGDQSSLIAATMHRNSDYDAVAAAVGVSVGVGVSVSVGVSVGVSSGVSVSVGVALAAGVPRGVLVGVTTLVGVSVRVGLGVILGVGDGNELPNVSRRALTSSI